jgi:histidinol-phosphate phosphatase family protein
MRRKALFIDRDGTINKDCPYCHNISDLVLYEDAIKIMNEYQEKGYIIIIITNQSGIGRGYFTEKEFHVFNDELLRILKNRGINITRTYFCPHKPDDQCNCRKPKIGMIEEAISDFEIDLENSIIIGDRVEIEGIMAKKIGIKYKIFDRENSGKFI